MPPLDYVVQSRQKRKSNNNNSWHWQQTALPHSILFYSSSPRPFALPAMTSRSRRSKMITTIFCSVALTSMLLVRPCHAHSRTMNIGKNRRKDLVTNNSDEGGPYTSRVRIEPFEIVLSPTPAALSNSAEREILDALRVTIGRTQTLPEGSVLMYVFLAGVSENTFVAGNNPSDRRLEASDPKTILSIDGGTISFEVQEEGSGTPSSSEVDGWVETAVNEELVTQLQQSSLNYVTSSGYLPITASPTTAPTWTPFIPAGLDVEPRTNEGGSDTNIWVIIGASVGGVLVMSVLAAFFLVARHKNSKKSDSEVSDTETYEIDGYPEGSVEEAQNDPAPSVDARYGADAVSVTSDWTVSSTQTTKSGDTRPSVFSAPVERTESFEIDRQVMLRKDMLHLSPVWYSESPIHTGGAGTVLQPSYFSAKTEMKRKLLRQGKNESSSQELSADELGNGDGESQGDVLFLFEANGGGEEMYIMPPNQINGRKSGSVKA